MNTSAFAAKPLSQGQALGQCKALASTQFENVKKIRVAHMKTTRGQFKAKLRVKSDTDNGMFLCTIARDQDAQIVRLDKNSGTIAAK
jgi:hypothetical protein